MLNKKTIIGSKWVANRTCFHEFEEGDLLVVTDVEDDACSRVYATNTRNEARIYLDEIENLHKDHYWFRLNVGYVKPNGERILAQ